MQLHLRRAKSLRLDRGSVTLRARVDPRSFTAMQVKLITLSLFAVAALAACTTRPVAVNTPGPGETVVQVPVLANANMKLTDDVRANLETAMGSDAAGIEVRVDGTTVYLTGHVATEELRAKAHSVAHGTAGVSTVVYEGLTVN
jgi:hypothetical protein